MRGATREGDQSAAQPMGGPPADFTYCDWLGRRWCCVVAARGATKRNASYPALRLFALRQSKLCVNMWPAAAECGARRRLLCRAA
jgi:hypothetical protein